MTFIFVFCLWIFSLCIHEYAHARVAFAGGDVTVEEKGYLSMNPLRYTDPVYSIIMPLLFLALGGIGLPGGAVYIETNRLRSKAWKSAVSAAGPASNLLLALFFGVIFWLVPHQDNQFWAAIAFVALLETTAVILNLLPIPPLDGYGILEPWLPASIRTHMRSFSRIGILVLFILLWYVDPVNDGFWTLVYTVTNALGVPSDLAWEGFRAFRFWKAQ
ncbi:site-2 protease family protein [Planctomycetota bacterium]